MHSTEYRHLSSTIVPRGSYTGNKKWSKGKILLENEFRLLIILPYVRKAIDALNDQAFMKNKEAELKKHRRPKKFTIIKDLPTEDGWITYKDLFKISGIRHENISKNLNVLEEWDLIERDRIKWKLNSTDGSAMAVRLKPTSKTMIFLYRLMQEITENEIKGKVSARMAHVLNLRAYGRLHEFLSSDFVKLLSPQHRNKALKTIIEEIKEDKAIMDAEIRLLKEYIKT